jgi:hypothetical protein
MLWICQIRLGLAPNAMTASFTIDDHASLLPIDVDSRQLSGAKMSDEAPLDRCDLAHLVIEGLFSLVFPDPHARQRLGLKAISRSRHETMSWALWTTSRLGAFEMALLPGSPESHPDGALFALRYFPDPREAVFARFAPIEQQTRLSPLFDATGTPATDSSGQLDPSLFHVGTLAIVPQGSNHHGICLSAQDLWNEYTHGDGGWRRRRAVPGLRLALGVLDPLVCGLSYLGRQPPTLVRAWRNPGLAWYIEAGGDAQSRTDPDASAWEIELHGLLVPGRAGVAGRVHVPARALEQPLFEYAAEIPPHYAPWPISPQWWQAAGWQFDPVGEFCSQCAAEEAGHEQHSHFAMTRSDDDDD